jgi:hypothetical protein
MNGLCAHGDDRDWAGLWDSSGVVENRRSAGERSEEEGSGPTGPDERRRVGAWVPGELEADVEEVGAR